MILPSNLRKETIMFIQTVLFLGGSITCGCEASDRNKGWAGLVGRWLSDQPQAKNCRQINSSISGTGSFLAAMRLQEHVLPYRPDAVFVEFSVNDFEDARKEPELVIASLESVVDQLLNNNPQTAIIFIYTTMKGQNAAEVHHQVAQHYGIPEIDLQTAILTELEKKKLPWNHYFHDAAHPNDAGHAFYADRVIEALKDNWNRFFSPVQKALPMAIHSLVDPQILPVSAAFDLKGFVLKPVVDDVSWKHLPETVVTYALCAEQPEASLKVRFTGTCFGLYHRIGNGCGLCAVRIDGVDMGVSDFYHDYGSDYDYPGEFLCFCRFWKLAEGEHIAEVTALGKRNELASDARIEIAGFLIE